MNQVLYKKAAATPEIQMPFSDFTVAFTMSQV